MSVIQKFEVDLETVELENEQLKKDNARLQDAIEAEIDLRMEMKQDHQDVLEELRQDHARDTYRIQARLLAFLDAVVLMGISEAEFDMLIQRQDADALLKRIQEAARGV